MISNIMNFVNKSNPTDLPNSFKQLLKQVGNETITSIKLFRKPLNQIFYTLFNVFTLGEFQNRLSRSPYDDLFHLGMIINNKIILEKTEIATLKPYSRSYLNVEGVEYLDVPVNQSITINDFINRTYQSVGQDYLRYNAMTNNCQIFVRNHLQANNMLTPDIENFVMQDVQNIFKYNTFLKDLMLKITNLGTNFKYTIGGKITINKDGYLETTSNVQLLTYANKLNLKLVGIYMNDELDQFLRKPLPKGNYIINLDDQRNEGTHWTCFVKQKNEIYYNDSFGVYPPQVIDNIAKEHKLTYYFNTRNNQEIKSNSCGYWCIYFLYWMNSKNKKPYLNKYIEFNDKFVEDTKINEKILIKEIKKIL